NWGREARPPNAGVRVVQDPYGVGAGHEELPGREEIGEPAVEFTRDRAEHPACLGIQSPGPWLALARDDELVGTRDVGDRQVVVVLLVIDVKDFLAGGQIPHGADATGQAGQELAVRREAKTEP